MALNVEELRETLNSLKAAGFEYFDCISGLDDDSILRWRDYDSDHFWNQLDESQQGMSIKLQSNILESVKMISNCIAHSPLLTEADNRDLSRWAKSLRSALRLRRYFAWDTELLHDEDIVLGVKPSGQSDDDPMDRDKARLVFERGIVNLLNLVDLIELEPKQRFDERMVNPQATVRYEPNTAFVMIQIDPSKPGLEDLYNVYKECFERFGITAVRADEIEHQEAITDKIIEKIKCSEFLLADLTAERPSVYYEIGYAHALVKKVIMFRSSNTKLHFDLAGYNCPDYQNLTELRNKLTRRLEHMTNRKPK